jgi:hypothetical protein
MGFATTTDVRLYYCVEVNSSADLPVDQIWERVPITSESFTTSQEITNISRLRQTSGNYENTTSFVEASGGLEQELELTEFFVNALVTILGSNAYRVFPHSGLQSTLIENGINDQELAFLKVVETEDTLDYYVYRGCQFSSVSIDFSGDLPSASYSLNVSSLGNPSQLEPHYLELDLSNLPAAITNWTFNDGISVPQDYRMLSDILIKFSATEYETSFSDFNLTLSRSLTKIRPLNGNVHTSVIYGGEVQAEVSGNVYFQHPKLYKSLFTEARFNLSFSLTDERGQTATFSIPSTKPTEISEPVAGSADSDLLVSTTFTAEQRSETPLITIQVTP